MSKPASPPADPTPAPKKGPGRPRIHPPKDPNRPKAVGAKGNPMGRKPGGKNNPLVKELGMSVLDMTRPVRLAKYGMLSSAGEFREPSKSKPWQDALRRALLQSDAKMLRKLADALIKKASEGDVAALKEIGDRVDGKAVQQVEQKVDAIIQVLSSDEKL